MEYPTIDSLIDTLEKYRGHTYYAVGNYDGDASIHIVGTYLEIKLP